MTRLSLTFALVFVSSAASAQGVRVSRGVPPGHLPPPGMCRVWYDNLPPGRQPPATTCERAEREAWRSGGQVIYGDRWSDRDDRYDRREGRRDRRNRRNDRDCDAWGRRSDDCDRQGDWCRDRNRDGRCDRGVRESHGALGELLSGVLGGRGRRGVRPGEWGNRDDVADSIPDGRR